MFIEGIEKSTLHDDNAKDIYESLSHLKGGALKVAQMMSLDQGILPKAYQEKFTQAQYSAPPLSLPLITKTFQNLRYLLCCNCYPKKALGTCALPFQSL